MPDTALIAEISIRENLRRLDTRMVLTEPIALTTHKGVSGAIGQSLLDGSTLGSGRGGFGRVTEAPLTTKLTSDSRPATSYSEKLQCGRCRMRRLVRPLLAAHDAVSVVQ